MVFLISCALFLLGAIIASFIGVVTARLATGQSFLRGRSRCDACAMLLGPYQLVPILSYFATKGRSYCCGARLSWVAPLSEFLLGALFVLAYCTVGFTYALPFMLAALSLLLALVLYDLAHQILPFPLLIPFVVVSALFSILSADSVQAFLNTFLVASVLAGILATIHVVSRGRAMGLADTPFVFGCALLAGPAAFSGFIFSFWIGAIIGILLLVRRPRGSRMGVEVPFAPFLAAGFLLAYFTQWNPFIFVAAMSSH